MPQMYALRKYIFVVLALDETMCYPTCQEQILDGAYLVLSPKFRTVSMTVILHLHLIKFYKASKRY